MYRASVVKVQQELPFGRVRKKPKHAGGRPPKGPRSSERHEQRKAFRASEPVHVTIRVVRAVSNLRTRSLYHAIRWATYAAMKRDSFRIVQLSIQRDHIHLLVEAEHRTALARGMQGFQISAARHINAALERRGQVFADRYHAHILRTPREVRHALAYVVNNWRKHGEDRGRTWKIDPFSSAVRFGGWAELAHAAHLYKPPPTYQPLLTWLPKTWLLATGWQRHGLVPTAEIPGPRPRR
jgi:REP element-mobilizing transposase RayT